MGNSIKSRKKDKAITVALSFPEGSEVRDQVFCECKIEDLNKDNGLKTLIESLDKTYKKDDLTAAYESWTKFDTFKREPTESMENYISQFDMRSIALSKHNVTIPKCILAFKLLDSAGLDIKGKQLVLTGVKFSEPDTMYDSMKLSLKKFFGSQEVLSLSAGNANNSNNIELKYAFLIFEKDWFVCNEYTLEHIPIKLRAWYYICLSYLFIFIKEWESVKLQSYYFKSYHLLYCAT